MEKKISKKFAFSIAYAIVALVVVAIAILGLTPVLTRKLPNLSTSSMIKNPKGWYESFNAPRDDKDVKYCKDCLIADCLKEKEKDNSIQCDPGYDKKEWPTTPTYDDKLPAPEDSDFCKQDKNKYKAKCCIGNPRCNPYVKNPEKDIISFEQYCKSNGTCGCPSDKYNNNPAYNKYAKRACPCRDGKCEFKPTKGVAKFEVYAIGGGGGSGSAVAINGTPPSGFNPATATGPSGPSDPSKPYSGYKWSKKYGDIVGGRNNKNITDDYDKEPISLPSVPNKTKTYLGDEIEHRVIPDNEIVKADFIDENKHATSGGMIMASGDFYTANPQTPICKKCHSGDTGACKDCLKDIFHRYPTEDFSGYRDDSKTLAERVSKKQVERILTDNEKRRDITYTVGTISPKISHRYYLYTKELGVYSYNQNPTYMLMPEWLKVDGKEPKYECGIDIFENDLLNYKCCKMSNGKSVLYRKTNKGDTSCPEDDSQVPQCVLTGCKPNCDKTKHSNNPDAIICKYPNAGSVGCSGNGGKGADAMYDNTLGNCDFMVETKPQTCVYDASVTTGLVTKPQPRVENNHTSCLSMYTLPRCQSACYLDNTYEKEDGTIINEYTRHYNDVCAATCKYKPIKTSDWYDCSCPETRRSGEYCDRNDNCGGHSAVCGGSFGTPSCDTRISNYCTRQNGGAGGRGVCGYISKKVGDRRIVKLVSGGQADNGVPKILNNSSGASSSYSAEKGNDGHPSIPKIELENEKATLSITITGGVGGKGGKVDTCGTGNKHSASCGATQGTAATGADGIVPVNNEGDYSSGPVPSDPNTPGKPYTGIGSTPGLYNYHYIWYMPFVTKHLMFGTAGASGEEIHTMITLTEDDTLEVNPGQGALITPYASGKNGDRGGDSTVENKLTKKVKLTAKGGNGGIGSQKTDEYVLCHANDGQDNNRLPCYSKTTKDTSGIKAIQPIQAKTVQAMKMSGNLKGSKPGIGGMGFGTKSLSDFVCDDRYVDKWDKIDNLPERKTTEAIREPAKADKKPLCNGNSKIKYILPHGHEYYSGTGAVVILW